MKVDDRFLPVEYTVHPDIDLTNLICCNNMVKKMSCGYQHVMIIKSDDILYYTGQDNRG